MSKDIIQGTFITFFIIGLSGFAFSKIRGDLFNSIIQNVQTTPLETRLYPILLSYLFMAFIIYYFLIFKNATTIEAGLLGMLIFGIYNLFNYATLKKWDIVYCIFDILWGGILFALGYTIVKMLM